MVVSSGSRRRIVSQHDGKMPLGCILIVDSLLVDYVSPLGF